VGAKSRVVGIDMDEVKVRLAERMVADQGRTNVEFRVLSVYDWDEPETYDLVYCRNVLQHLADPTRVLRAMWSALRPGGVILVEDADFEGSFCDPPNAGFDFWVDAYPKALAASGGDPLSGRKLHRLFADAGIPAPEVTVVQRADVTGEAKTLPHSTIALTADGIIAHGIATREQVDAALVELLALADDPGSICGSPRIFQAWSRR
jgi:SAM-dependent methyltransferase